MGAGLLRFLEAATILDVNRQVAERYAEIRGGLRAKGLLLDNRDLLIAATALHHDLTLVTRNHRHFGRVPGIKLYP
jgi:predicted nucleic acid-binding protein